MSLNFNSKSGENLYRIIPAIYREKDEGGDLAAYLDVCGDLLDQVHDILKQRYEDTFPDSAQTWLLPYFAQLLDVHPVSPDRIGRLAEVENAVVWRQKKGTPSSVEQIGQAIGQTELVMHEGYRRTAVTPVVGRPLYSPVVYGSDEEFVSGQPMDLSRHPGLPAITPDFRQTMQSREVTQESPVTEISRFQGRDVIWAYSGKNGFPLFRGSYEDITRRTPDMRNTSTHAGHIHPKRVLLFAPLEDVFFPTDQATVQSGNNWSDYILVYDEYREEDGSNLLVRHYVGREDKVVRIQGVVIPDSTLPDGVDELLHYYKNIYFADGVVQSGGRLRMERCAATSVHVSTVGTDTPVFQATDCLLGGVEVPAGYVLLEYVTVLNDLTAPKLNASDCIFSGAMKNADGSDELPEEGVIRYSRIPASPVFEANRISFCTSDIPIFMNRQWGKAGCAMLHPETSRSISAACEEGGEMGAYHHRRIGLTRDAMIKKLKNFLPVGIEPVIIPDCRMNAKPAQ